jgi:hypothetical protein
MLLTAGLEGSGFEGYCSRSCHHDSDCLFYITLPFHPGKIGSVRNIKYNGI